MILNLLIAAPLRLVLGVFSGSYYLSLIDTGMLGHNLECTFQLYTKEERTACRSEKKDIRLIIKQKMFPNMPIIC